MAFGKEIKRLREFHNVSAQVLVDVLGVDYNRFKGWERKDLNPKQDDTLLIESYFGISIKEFEHLEKLPKVPTADEAKIAKLERESSKATPNEETYTEKRRGSKNIESIYMVPLLPVTAQAGYARSTDIVAFLRNAEMYPIAPGVNYRGADWRWIEVEGESMEPHFVEGDFILCSSLPHEDWKQFEATYVYVIVTHEQVLLKRIEALSKDEWLLKSDNPAYRPFSIKVKDVREVWKFRRNLNARVPPPPAAA